MKFSKKTNKVLASETNPGKLYIFGHKKDKKIYMRVTISDEEVNQLNHKKRNLYPFMDLEYGWIYYYKGDKTCFELKHYKFEIDLDNIGE